MAGIDDDIPGSLILKSLHLFLTGRTIRLPLQFPAIKGAERFRWCFCAGAVKIYRFAESRSVEEQTQALRALISLEKIIKGDQAEKDPAAGAGNALWVLAQDPQPLCIDLGEMIVLTMLTEIVIPLPKKNHGRAAMGTIHTFSFLYLQ